MNSLKPPPSVLVKLGSLAIHVREMLSPDGRKIDRMEVQMLLDDPEVKEWFAAMDKLGFLPVERIKRKEVSK